MGYQLMQGDCIQRMAELPAASVDLVLCDPPYGTTQNAWDAAIPFVDMWAAIDRVLRPGGAVVLTACQPFSSALVMSRPSWFRHEWVWHKNKASGHLNAKRAPMRAHELVLVFAAAAPSYTPQMTIGHRPGNYAKRGKQSTNYGSADSTVYGGSTVRYPRSVQDFPVVNNDDSEKTHPTQKPVDLMEYLTRTYSQPGDTVLDFTMGSGTTGVACAKTGRKFIGIEQDELHFSTANARIAVAYASEFL